jgi:hypothetical protein
MKGRPIRLSVALTIAEYTALDWYAARVHAPTSSLARAMMFEALLPRLQAGTLEGSAYADEMHTQKQPLVTEEER